MKRVLVAAALAAGMMAGPTQLAEADSAPRMFVGVPACQYDDGSGPATCVWDAKHMGNGLGRSFLKTTYGVRRYDNEEKKLVTIERVLYVKVSHRVAHRLHHKGY